MLAPVSTAQWTIQSPVLERPDLLYGYPVVTSKNESDNKPSKLFYFSFRAAGTFPETRLVVRFLILHNSLIYPDSLTSGMGIARRKPPGRSPVGDVAEALTKIRIPTREILFLTLPQIR